MSSGSGPGTPVAWSTDGIGQRAHGLTGLSAASPAVKLLDVVLLERFDAVDDDVGAEAVHRQRARGRPPPASRSGRPARPSRSPAPGSRRRTASAPATPPVHLVLVKARGAGVEAHQPARRADRLREPGRGGVVAVVGQHACRPRCFTSRVRVVLGRGRPSGISRRSMPGARSSQRVALQMRGDDQRHARILALGQELAVFVHHHPFAVVHIVDRQAGAGQRRCAHGDAARRI